MADFTKDKLSEKDLVLELVREISRKFLIEFRGGSHTKMVYHGNMSEKIQLPDSRAEAIQGCELLTLFLRPHYEEKKCKDLGMKKKDEDTQKKAKELLKKYEKKEISEDEYMRDKLLLMRDWLGELLILLNRTKYLGKKTAL